MKIAAEYEISSYIDPCTDDIDILEICPRYHSTA